MRLRVRTLMIAIAVVAFLFASAFGIRRLVERSRFYSRLAADNDILLLQFRDGEVERMRSARIYRDIARQLRSGRTPLNFQGWDDSSLEKVKDYSPRQAAAFLDEEAGGYDFLAQRARAWRIYHEEMRRIYRKAARYPWLAFDDNGSRPLSHVFREQPMPVPPYWWQTKMDQRQLEIRKRHGIQLSR